MVKKIIAKPHLFFFGLVPIFVFIGLINREKFININIDYFYFDIKINLLCYLSSIFLLLIGFNYFSLEWANKKPRKILTIFHLVLQIISLISFFILIFSINTKGSFEIEILNNYLFFLVSFLIFLLSVFIHLINFFTSLFLKTK